MSDDTVKVPFEDDGGDQATLLLAAAEELDLDAGVVQTVGGAFVVPKKVHDKAFGSNKSSDSKAAKKSPAKKAAAKKATAKKSQE